MIDLAYCWDKRLGERSIQNLQHLVIRDQRFVSSVDTGKSALLYPSAQGILADVVSILHELEMNLADGSDFTMLHV